MAVTVCFDALGTCFSVDVLVEAMDELLGERLREAGSGARMTVMDWFHSAQRDYTYLSIISPPPPPISQILTLTLPRSIYYALNSPPSLHESLPDLSPIISKLTALTPSPTLVEALNLLKYPSSSSTGANNSSNKILIITNGSKSTTEGYVKSAGLEGLVDDVRSCDEVGLAKPFAGVYEGAMEACEGVEKSQGGRGKGERWFVAAHMWDVAAARKVGFKTGIVMAEQPPLGQTQDGKNQLDSWYDLYGGKPDVIGSTLLEVAQEILKAEKQ